MAAQLKYSSSWYSPASLRSGNISIEEIKAEYTRLRDIAQKRLGRMAGTQFAETRVFKRNIKGFAKIRDMAGRGVKGNRVSAELAYNLADLARFVSSPSSTIGGQIRQMKKTLSTLHKHHYTFVNESNYILFGQFMEEWKQQHLDWQYDSGDAADLYEQVERHKMDPAKVADDFQYWLDNRVELKDLPPGKSTSVKVIKKRIEAQKRRKERKGTKK